LAAERSVRVIIIITHIFGHQFYLILPVHCLFTCYACILFIITAQQYHSTLS
jgi:hypothetical protein